nr:reverse transcriptase domain-containing protein [Tanacetum cinerariifolium]
MHKAFPLSVIEFPLEEEVPTTSEKSFHCQKKRDATTKRIALLKLEVIKNEKEGLESKLTGFKSATKDLDHLIGSQRSDKIKEGLGYSVVPPPPAQLYSPPKKDMSWTGLPKFADDTVTNYTRPAPTVESSPDDAQNKNPSVTATEASPNIITSKPAIKFVKAAERPKTDKVKTTKKPTIKYVELYRKTTKRACFNCGHFDHLSYDCGLGVKKGITRPQNNTHRSLPPRPAIHKPYRPPMRQMRPNMNVAWPNRTSFYKSAHSYTKRSFQETTQDLMIILIQRVQRLEIELKARTPIQKVDRGRSRCSIKFRRGLLRIKCSKIFPLSVMNSHCQKKFPLLEEVSTARVILPLSELANLTHAVNQQTSVVTTAMMAMLKQFQSNPPTAQVKAVEEICVTCGGAHPYYQCLAAGGNTFPEYWDNIQESGTLPGNTITNPKGELKAITTRSGLVTEGPTVPNPPKSVNPEEDECVEETYTDPDHAEYNIKVPPPPLVQKPKPPIQRNFVIHTRDSLLSHPGKFLIPCGFSELKCKALADLGASINLMPLSVWKKLGLPDLIPTQMTLELANRAICTPDGIARDEFADELALISYPPNYDDNRACDIESDIREIEFLLFQGEDSDFKDSIDQSVLTHCDDLFV